MSSKKWRNKNMPRPSPPTVRADLIPPDQFSTDIVKLERLPTTYQDITALITKYKEARIAELRFETIRRIESVTKIPLICYVTKTHNVNPQIPAGIDDSDLIGFSDLIAGVAGDSVDVLVVSNGGTAEATQRIVSLLRGRFEHVRFIVPGNAYSAATLLCFSGDSILMSTQATLGPIDPQFQGIPVRAILRGFEEVEKRLAEEGPKALTAYLPLIQKYDLHLLEMCKSAELLSEELATKWLGQYMLKTDLQDERVIRIVQYFKSYDLHKTHARPIGRVVAQELGLVVIPIESVDGLGDLVIGLFNQYAIMFDKSPFFKVYEDARGVNWGRRGAEVAIEIPQTGPPQRSDRG